MTVMTYQQCLEEQRKYYEGKGYNMSPEIPWHAGQGIKTGPSVIQWPSEPGETLYAMPEKTFQRTFRFWLVFFTLNGMFVGSMLTLLAHLAGWWG